MEVRVQLKICESCGCLWYRGHSQENVYCRACDQKLKEFPTPETRKRPGRPARIRLAKVFGVAEAFGGAQ
jgi:hypothetical protein